MGSGAWEALVDRGLAWSYASGCRQFHGVHVVCLACSAQVLEAGHEVSVEPVLELGTAPGRGMGYLQVLPLGELPRPGKSVGSWPPSQAFCAFGTRDLLIAVEATASSPFGIHHE